MPSIDFNLREPSYDGARKATARVPVLHGKDEKDGDFDDYDDKMKDVRQSKWVGVSHDKIVKCTSPLNRVG